MTTILEWFNALVSYFMHFMHCIKMPHNDEKFTRAPQLMFNSGGTSRIIVIIIIIVTIIIFIIITIIIIFDSNMY